MGRGKAVAGRQTAEIDGDFVVFLIGAGITVRHPIRSLRDLGGLRGMQYMLKYLEQHPEKGLLHYEMPTPFYIVQYWRSFEDLEAFSRNDDEPHRPAWRKYWKRVGKDNRSAIWHETFLVQAGEYEAIYANCKPRGLALAGRLVPVNESSTARLRIRRKAA